MWSNTEREENGGNQNEQPQLTDFVERTCSVCGRKYGENETPCHSPEVVSFERRLTAQKWLLPRHRSPETHITPHVIGNDGLSFEPLYSALRSLIETESTGFDEYLSNTPYDIRPQEWLAEAFRQDLLLKHDELVLGPLAGIKASEQRIKQKGKEVTPARVFAHVVFLDQYGLIPGYGGLRRGHTKDLREVCANHYGVQPDALDSKWIIKRRVDRSKVYSTTAEFRQVWDVELVDTYPENASHPYSDFKPFDGRAILDAHRDHNLVACRMKTQLLRLPNVDWAISPHLIYSRSDYDSSKETSSSLPVLGFDVAGFEYTTDGQRLRYLGVVTEWEESPFETYLQAAQIGKTAATGILVLPNRESIYDFLHFLKCSKLTDCPGVFPESREKYRSLPNVQKLHEQLIRQIPLLDGMALLPRRRFLDEGVDTLNDLVSVPTYA